MKKYYIRFYLQAWVDIPVEAEDLDDAYQKAGDKYNNGDYDGSDMEFENVSSIDVTDEYLARSL